MTGTERKVLNKYYPPDFDPRKIPKCKVERNRQYVIRVMAPFNMRCNTCGEYIYKGKKFNARRETVEDNDYLGLSLFRFYIRCPGCLAEITFTTDLKNCDYAQEHGSTRLFEADKLLREQDREIQRQEAEDATNPMKMLEKRTKMSRFEMDALERLEELKEINQRQGKTDYTALLHEVTKDQEAALRRQEVEDEEFVKSVFGPKKEKRRLSESDEEEGEEESAPFEESKPSTSKPTKDKPPIVVKKSKFLNQKDILKGVVMKKSTVPKVEIVPKKKVDEEKPSASVLPIKSGLSLLGDYASSSDSD